MSASSSIRNQRFVSRTDPQIRLPVYARCGLAALTGFIDAVFTGTTLLTLTFAHFEPNETFIFQTDVDDTNNRVQSAFIAGSLITATFDIFGGSDLSAAMVAVGSNDDIWSATTTVVPEPGTFSLLSLGLIGLAWEARRARTPSSWKRRTQR
jgi:hypothetical protein